MQVFISHADADSDLAWELAAGLSEAGIDVWFARDQLFPGDNWQLAIGKALERSKAMIVLVSPESVKSTFVRSEIQFALGSLNYENRVIPVLVRPTDKIPWML